MTTGGWRRPRAASGEVLIFLLLLLLLARLLTGQTSVWHAPRSLLLLPLPSMSICTLHLVGKHRRH